MALPAAASSAAALPPAELAASCAAEEGLLVRPPSPAFGVESDADSSPDSADVPAQGVSRLRRHRRLVIAAFGSALLLGCAALGAGVRRQPPTPTSHSLDESVELGAFGDMLGTLATMAEGVHEAAELSDDVETSYKSIKGIFHSINSSSNTFGGFGAKLVHEFKKGPEWRKELKRKFQALNATQKEKVKQKLFKRFNITSLKQLRPKANMHDGNRCADDEEEEGELCYKKCSILTGGHFPYRVSAWECCQHAGPCPTHFRINFKLCNGFDISGDQLSGKCPHTPGGCLKTEELYGNFCYKRCSLLTYSVLSARAGPATCCKPERAQDWLAFLETDGCDTQDAYRQGGGRGDGDASTPVQPHMPMVSLTES